MNYLPKVGSIVLENLLQMAFVLSMRMMKQSALSVVEFHILKKKHVFHPIAHSYLHNKVIY